MVPDGAQLKTEEEWILLHGTHVLVQLIADASTQTILPLNFKPMGIRIESTCTIQDLKETLCGRIGEAKLRPDMLVLRLLNGGLQLEEAMSLA